MNNTPSATAVHCFIKAPFDYLCLREYLETAPYERRYLYVLSTSHHSIEQIKMLADRNLWTAVYLFDRRPSRVGNVLVTTADKLGSLCMLAQIRMRLSRHLKHIKTQDDVVLSILGSAYSRLVIRRCRVLKRKAVVIDNGFSTFREFRVLAQEGELNAQNTPSSKSFLNRVERLMYPRGSIYAQDVQYFSVWPLHISPGSSKPTILPRNNLSVLYKNVPTVKTEKTVYFLGQPHIRTGMLTQKQYSDILAKIAGYYQCAGIEFLYFPHPRENHEISDKQFRIVTLDRPFEAHLMQIAYKPTVIASLYSTAVLTSYYIFRDTIEYVFFWGFPDFAEKRRRNSLVDYLVRYEADRSNCISINESLK